MLALLAMGNWVNTNSPPLDGGAPGASGNSGELELEIDGETYICSVQSAMLAGDTLRLQGELVGGKPQFSISAHMPRRSLNDSGLRLEALRGASLAVNSAALELDGKTVALSGGTIKLSSATGSGPWEFDGDLLLQGESQTYRGSLQVRVSQG